MASPAHQQGQTIMSTAADLGNHRIYLTPGVAERYRQRTLTQVEAVALLKYHDAFAGRDVLDLGVGTGRSSIYLAPLAQRYEAIDYSPQMVAAMHAAMPALSVRLGDMRDLVDFPDASFDFVFGPNNVIDAVGSEGRQRTVGEVARVLRHKGMFMFSSHNWDSADALSGPRLEWSLDPCAMLLHLTEWARQLANHRRMTTLREVHDDYALLDDYGHDFTLLHFYATQNYERQQLDTAGFETIDVLDRTGNAVSPEDHTPGSPYLMYVARRIRACTVTSQLAQKLP